MLSFKGNGFEFPLGKRTYIMGILNITPDSFYDGGRYNTLEKAVAHAKKMETDSADIIDVGANSTRPDADILSCGDEMAILKRLLPDIVKSVDVPVSVDTFYPETAEFALECGARIINDVSGRITPEMSQLIKRYNAGYIVTHNPLFSSKASRDYSCEGGVVNSVKSFFEKAQSELLGFGIGNGQLLFDIGIGFSKSEDDNPELIKNLHLLKTDERALLTALSNKRMTAVCADMAKEERLFSTIAADTLAIAGGTDFIRVHNVREAKIAVLMADRIAR